PNLNLAWRLTWRDRPDGPDHEWVEALVPGAVQRDWQRHFDLPDPHTAIHPETYGWMEDVWWIYRAELPALQAAEGEEIVFRAEGIDYAFEVFRDDRLLLRGEGMFAPVRVPLGRGIGEGETLEVRIAPVPKAAGETGRAEARRSCKPACAYGWDWHPRLIPSGIWRPCMLRAEARDRIEGLYPRTEVSENLATATIHPGIECAGGGPRRLAIDVIDPEGAVVAQRETDGEGANAPIELADPQLWWPAGHGDQPRYTIRVRLLDAGGGLRDEKESRFGLRRLRLVMNTGAWDSPALFPKSRSAAPATFEINGRRIFAKGSNWIPPRLFPGEIDDRDYDRLVELAAEAHFNILRVWGGGIVPPVHFFERCDERGIMVIQEFPLACNDYPDDPAYLEVLRSEADSIIRRLRRFPSLVLWSGGNELFNSWSGMTDQSRALRLLNARCLELDPDRPFVPTMPVEGMGHGPYTYIERERGLEVGPLVEASANTACTEFGQPGAAPLECLERILPPEERFPPRPGTAWERHHGLKAFYPESWLSENILEHQFGGPARDLRELVERSQWLQSFGYRMLFEGVRRQWPKASMAINWCFNEVWPCAANNSLLAWPDIPKPAYHAVREACRPTLLAAALERFVWQPGEPFHCRLSLLNDAPEARAATGVTVELASAGKRLSLLDGLSLRAEALRNSAPVEVEGRLPAHWQSDSFELVLRSGEAAFDSRYRLRLGEPPEGPPVFQAMPGDTDRLNQ
ncbi:MAG: glycoside hydrolase family 2 protein, partial [Puniceicoccaceae bacterium]